MRRDLNDARRWPRRDLDASTSCRKTSNFEDLRQAGAQQPCPWQRPCCEARQARARSRPQLTPAGRGGFGRGLHCTPGAGGATEGFQLVKTVLDASRERSVGCKRRCGETHAELTIKKKKKKERKRNQTPNQRFQTNEYFGRAFLLLRMKGS